jgi:hypothetical protein
MHADTLYHRMLDQEKQISEAKKAGKPIPEFKPLMAGRSGAQPLVVTEASSGEPDKADKNAKVAAAPLPPELADMAEKTKKEFEKRLEGLSPLQRELELMAIVREVKRNKETAGQLVDVRKEIKKDRSERLEAGKASIGDRIQKSFGW